MAERVQDDADPIVQHSRLKGKRGVARVVLNSPLPISLRCVMRNEGFRNDDRVTHATDRLTFRGVIPDVNEVRRAYELALQVGTAEVRRSFLD